MPNLSSAVVFAQQFDPQFPRRIRGSSRADIDALAALVGRALPAEYVAFLEAFGDADGGLKLAFDGTTELPDLLDFYRDYVGPGEVALPAGCLAIGVDAMTEEAICLEPSGRVVFTGEGRVRAGYADSLAHLVFRTISIKLRSATFAHQKIFLGAREDHFASAVGAAERLGFARAEYSDAFAFCGEKAGALVHLIQYQGEPLSAHFACADAAFFERLDELVREEFGMSGKALQES